VPKEKKKPTYDEALAILEDTAVPSERLATALAYAAGVDSSEETAKEVLEFTKDAQDRMRLALHSIAQMRMGSMGDSLLLVSSIERELREDLKNNSDLSPAEKARIKQILDKSIRNDVELFKDLAFAPRSASLPSVDLRSININYGDLSTLPSAQREKLRLLVQNLLSPGEGQVIDAEVIEAEDDNSDDNPPDENGGPEASD
jgi:hypothetical protein